MRVLVACEYSGVVRDAFTALGHYAMSCDILDTESEGPHYKGDVLDILDNGWDLMIAHPPCTYVAASGMHWNKNNTERKVKTVNALEFIETLFCAPIERVAIENPVGVISTRTSIGKAQYIQPYWFGDDASKKTGLWKRGLPDLVPTCMVEGRRVLSGGREVIRWGNQDDNGQENTPNTKNRAKLRSRTFPGFAAAMAAQWTF